ncbi:MAG: hypothetical protein KAJ42_15235 [Gemmatimonadetes bacterium]|nr:hypothetical protein [Gemmatimonadota bacterium]
MTDLPPLTDKDVIEAQTLVATVRRKRNERSYLAAVINQISTDDIEKVAAACVQDAIDGDLKVRSAAREWLGKYALGGGNVRPSDVHSPPVVRKSR